MPPEITAYGIQTGGVIAMSISGAVSGAATLERAVSGQAFSTIYSGAPISFYIDIGDGLPSPLSSGSAYVYRYTDATGSGLSSYITPSSVLVQQQEPLTQILIRLLQGAFANLTPPAGVRPVQVMQQMPLGGNIPMPFMVINLDLIQQSAVPIGQSVAPLSALVTGGGTGSGYTLTGFAKRTFRISVLSDNGIERDFYRDNLIGVLEAIYAPILQPLGLDVSHKWMASSGQIAKDIQGKAPGFYFADVLLDFEGTLNVVVTPVYGTIAQITTTVSGTSQATSTPVVDTITVPLSGLV
jgi:hypothetical protein